MFILSKLLTFLLNPLLWIVILIIWALVSKNRRHKKKIYIAALVVFVIFSNPYLFNLLFNRLQTERVELRHDENFTAGILLGGFANHDLRSNQSFFNASSDRFIQAALLYKKGRIRKIIVSGGNALGMESDLALTKFVAGNLVQLGIPTQDVIVESRSRNTRENARFCKEILDSLQLPGPYILVTSAFHVTRAKLEFEKAGLSIKPYPCAYLVVPSETRFTLDKLVPSAKTLDLWPLYLKEIAGLIMVRMKR